MRSKTAATALIAAFALAAPLSLSPPLVTAAFAQSQAQFQPQPQAKRATKAGAARLQKAISAYFGDVPGVVSVAPAGRHYTLTVNPKPIEAKLPAGVELALPRLTWRLGDLGDGLWQTSMDQKDLTLSIKVKDKLDQTIRIAQFATTGTFDEALMAFRESEASLHGVKIHSTGLKKGKLLSTTDYQIDRVESRSTASGTADSTDLKVDQTFSGLKEAVSVAPAAKDAPDGTASRPPRGMQFTMTMATGLQSLDVTGLRSAGILGLYRWILSHGPDAAKPAEREALAGVLETTLPVFDSLSGTGSADTITLQTPVGAFAVDHLAADVSANGVVTDGRLRERVTLQGLTMPDGLMPGWAAPLMPKKVVLDLAVSKFDLATPAGLLLDALKSGEKPDTPGMKDKLTAALLPEGQVKIATADTAVIGSDYALTVEGNAQIGPADKVPGFDFLITAKGYDSLLKAVDKMPDQLKTKAVPMLMLARGFSKPGANGDLNWTIQSSPEGHLMINGQDMGPLKHGGKP